MRRTLPVAMASAAILAASACSSSATKAQVAPPAPAAPITTAAPTWAAPNCPTTSDTVLLGNSICITRGPASLNTNKPGSTDLSDYSETMSFTFQNDSPYVFYTQTYANHWTASEDTQQVTSDCPNMTLAPGDTRVMTITFAGYGISEVIFDDPQLGAVYWHFTPQYPAGSGQTTFQ